MATMGTGFHAHILLIDYNIEPKKFFKNMNRKFSNICSGNLKETLYINNVERASWQDTMNDYFMGKNKQAEKETKVAFDKVWRELEGIAQLFHYGQIQDLPAEATLGTRLASVNPPEARVSMGVKKGVKRGPYKKKGVNMSKQAITKPISW